MKYTALSLLTLLLACGVAHAQGGSSNNSCEQFKIGIITPPKDIDFKIIIITPPQNIDPGMVINTCPPQTQVATAPRIVVPLKEADEFFKLPPFTIKNKYSQ